MAELDFLAFASLLRDVEAQTLTLEKRYEALFTEIGAHLLRHALDKDNAEQTMTHLYAFTEHALSEFLNSHFNKQSTACKAGCAYCCYLTVECPPQVVFHVANHLRQSRTREQITNLLNSLDAYTATMHPGARKNTACPFLNIDHKCEIYDVRPITCRVFTSPNVGLCRNFIEEQAKDIDSIPQHSLVYRVYEAATAALQAAAKHQKRDMSQLLFIPSLATALRNPTLEKEWQQGRELSRKETRPSVSEHLGPTTQA